ncbi:MAG TPA: hypothetical protein VGJ26_06275 [Pirellulales bacterium]|jgi:hypothetical protein
MTERFTLVGSKSSWRAISFVLLSVSVLAVASLGNLAGAQQAEPTGPAAKSSGAQPAPAKSLDDQLLEDLGPDPSADQGLTKPGDAGSKPAGASNKPTGTDKKATAKPKADIAKPAGDGLDEELLKGLTDGEDVGQAGEQTPLGRVNQEMREVESLIAGSRSDRATQQLQSKIVKDLDELIKQSAKQCQGGNCKPGSKSGQKTADSRSAKQPGKSSGSGKQPNEQPAHESTDKLRKHAAAKPDMADMKEILKGVWGQLPEHEREQMLQSYEEQFLPKYEQMIADYFRSIAEPESRARQK